ncbi:arsinothricin resistance N-acetyltransferase ArsN1 family B [Microbulbifer thermotolerans]|uniref:arsinothricin resistance N-acetyltransferase ArsN1 family B n=1 Tax=Microbulbifer thermotolerans TaxID=252514 RepID=UPI0022491D6C|nr:arsinothricin resistance N-acetyltransferase ArsN1 family B [Microbulbifer thermotolerans]MCX2778712.1 GNAT family N-acetyltransferase [Microbulbifer thermotolerans]MCX2803779.1 GNAT family N-acetyltransferase [Microbulbifer thermotolerans]MCX2830623.1 GNAT family N-acetyltransferase [Microbulbifer thermotolerans]MCX2842996.1 GNAT family N-acetyltransferase [Microbulbifer thermotolerans]
MIREAEKSDAARIAEIYNYYVENSFVTFEVDRVSEDEMAMRIQGCLESDLPWLVAEHKRSVIGYCYASPWKGRCAYRYSVESTVYLDISLTSKGWGTKLYNELLARLKKRGIHVVISGIALPNKASVALHEKFGMEKVAHFKEVGRKFERWIDVGYWQCLI